MQICHSTSSPYNCQLPELHIPRIFHRKVSHSLFPSSTQKMQKMQSQKPHIAMFPSWGTGHLIPFIEFAKRMASAHSFTVTFITSSFLLSQTQISQIQSLASSGLDIRLLQFPPPEEEDDPKTPHSNGDLFKMFHLIEQSKTPVHGLLQSLKTQISAFITDLFCTVMLEPCNSLQIPAYVLLTTSASNLCLMLYHPTLHAQTTLSLCETDGHIDIPGLPSMPTKYFPDPMQSRTSTIYYLFLRHSRRLCNARGILINTFSDLESATTRALVDRKTEILPDGVEKGPEIYPVGPLIRAPDSDESESGCVAWLDGQPAKSVILVSFGSMGALSAEQNRELALGLEGSGQRFLWVLRKAENPSESETEILPGGFEERIGGRGVVWRSWAPQIRVLEHPSIGGFVSHCGWNSVLESVSCGVPLVAWPLGAEQRTNGFFLVREIGVAIEPKWGDGWWVSKEEVGRVARELIGGEAGRGVRARAAELKESARKAWAFEGTSTEALSVLARQWKRI